MSEEKTSPMIALAVAILLGTGGGTAAYQIVNPSRPDAFTGAQAREMERRLKDVFETAIAKAQAEAARERAFAIKELKSDILSILPPPATKKRIQSLESHMRSRDGYDPPTYEWH